MADCTQLEQCKYFNEVLVTMPTVAEMMKERYCMGDPEQRARKIVLHAVGKKCVPLELAPKNVKRAHTIIANNKP